jgi:hypothetical protein
MQITSFLIVVPTSLVLASICCQSQDEGTRRVLPMLGPETGVGADSGAGVAVALPTVPTSGMSATPALSCGGLLGPSTCDPVTAWPCDTSAGETCDYSNSAGAFRCYLLPTAVPLCGFCDRDVEYCGPGTTCGGGRCEKYCCADSDCEQGVCVRDIFQEPNVAGAGYCPDDGIAMCGPNSALVEGEAAEGGEREDDAGSGPMRGQDRADAAIGE